MKLSICHMHEPLLHTKTEAIPLEKITSPETQALLDNMLSIYPTLPAVGLAAPQVGWNARVFIIGIEDEHSREDNEGMPVTLFINPEYEIIDDNRSTDWEGCFSVYNEPSQQMLGEVTRSTGIRFRAYDRNGNLFTQEYRNFRARVFQHECDHLDGIRYVNRMKNNQQLYFRQDNKAYHIYLHQIPKALRSGKFPILRELVPLLEHAPSNGISSKLLKEILAVYHNSGDNRK
ncbi:MAG: peptide deformylase [Legionellales bacterium]|nr:peptide deformylase [Legionellales bacterium]